MLAKKLQSTLAGQAAGGAFIEDCFSCYLYTGNGSTQTITNNIDLDGEGGLVWIKDRTTAYNHVLFDTLRGGTYRLGTQDSDAQISGANSYGYIPSFNSDGFSVAPGSSGAQHVSANGDKYASWTFRKAPKFFDVVTWTGNGANPRAISHSLGSVPGCIVIKRTSDIEDWKVYHRSLATSYYLQLNTTDAQINNTTGKPWNTTPTDTEFYVGGSSGQNITDETYVAYLFAHDAGGFGDAGDQSVIKCGSYSGTGSSNFIDLGWEPQFLIVKNTTTGGNNWFMYDNMRGLVMGSGDQALYPNLANAEGTRDEIDLNPTGFTLTSGLGASNASGATYVYIAIRRGPMKTPEVGTEVFLSNAYSGSGSSQSFSLGFVPDTTLTQRRDSTNFNVLESRLTKAFLLTHSTNAETPSSAINWSSNTNTVAIDATTSAWNASGYTYVNHSFRRAPGFFDVVCYAGNATAGTLTYHNLGVAPELIITRVRNVTGEDWVVHYNDGTSIIGAYLNKTDAFTAAGTAPSTDLTNFTSTTYTRNTANQRVNAAKNYVAYLFASCPGVSKVGSFTGNGSSLTVDCGFTNGARFVLIKRTDSTSGWYVWDTTRGIVAGNDARLRLESTGAEALWDDIDPDPSGFVAVAAGNINVSGGTYIFLAIA